MGMISPKYHTLLTFMVVILNARNQTETLGDIIIQ